MSGGREGGREGRREDILTPIPSYFFGSNYPKTVSSLN